jgi:DNA-binding CsgD family transcriptional regulator
MLRAAHATGRLRFFADDRALADGTAFGDYLEPLRKAEWVVYAKEPFGGLEAVLAYLSRYTHRVAISNHRLLEANQSGVTFRYLSERQTRAILAGVGVGSFVLLMTLDILTEPDEVEPLELLVDAVTVLLTIAAAVGVALLALRMQAQHEERIELIRDLETARREGRHWRSKVQSKLNGIKTEMEAQFRQWGMTAAERDVGLLILKGLNHKEIAALRGTSQATVRQQPQSIYQKAELPGKTAFSAYFLEDLFAPNVNTDEPQSNLSVEEEGSAGRGTEAHPF